MWLLIYFFVGLFCFSPFKVFAVSSKNADALHLDWIDNSISRSKNFFDYANGNWQKQNPIPADYARWGVFYSLQKQNEQIIRDIVENAAKNPYKQIGTVTQKIGDFYYSGMDIKNIDQLGATPLKSEFDQIDRIKSKADLQNVIAHLQMIGVNAVFSFGQMQDFKNSRNIIGVAGQGGLGLPDRDYYLKNDPKFKQIRQVYVAHIAKMLELLGDQASKAKQDADIILKMEVVLAKASMPLADQRNPAVIYHIMNLAQLEKETPNFSWKQYFANIGHPEIKSINLAMPGFFKTVSQQFSDIPLAHWKKYLRWHVTQSMAPYLSQPFVDENFRLRSVMTGAKALLPRWQRVIAEEDAALGFAIGKLYVAQNFPPSSKQAVLEMIHNIHNALKNDLETLAWMTPETRKLALKKLELMENRVGYPDRWRDYSALLIDRGPYVLNVLRANLFLSQYDLNKIGKPVDRNEWEMTPQTVNAYYDPSMNNLNIPAGILQKPFFDPDAPAAVNYGAIGVVIGHEMTHGFDDEGGQFDGYGNLNNWWSPVDLQKFQAATQCIVDQFSQYTVDGNVHIQGKLVAGEAIADLGGVILAYRAFHASPEYRHAKNISGYTPDQQFFLAAAHAFASHVRPEEMRRLATVDPHPPAMYRINGSLANVPQFQKAYQIRAGSPMINAKRCVIW